MQQELIEMLEEIIPYVEVWHKEGQDVLDKAEALVEKAKNSNAPAEPVYQLAKLGGPTETAWIDVTQEVYEDAGFYKDDFKRRILSATPAPSAAVPAQEAGLIARQFDLICQAIDKADTVTMEGDYMLDSDDCIAVVRVMQALFDIAALRAKGGE